MSTLPSSTAGAPRRPLPPHLVSDTPPTPSRSPSNASASGNDNEDESADESDYQDGDPDDPHASTLELSHLAPAVATPKPTGASSWPFGQSTGGGASQGAHNGDGSGGGGVVVSPTPEYALEQALIPASSLPHEILLHILRLLPPPSLAPALRVCKAWCQCGVELLWHKLSFTSVAALYKMLQVLSLPEQTFPYPDFVRRINFHPLASEMSDRVVAKLLPCTRLERITLTSCKSLSSAAMCALLVQSHRLVALDLTDVPNVDDDVLVALAANCPKVQGLNLSGCSRITDRGLEAIALGCPLLRRIKLRKCDLLTDTPIILLSLHCPLLLEVDLAFCSSITSLAVMQLLRSSHALREVSLPGCVLLEDDAFPDASQLTLLPPATRDDPHHLDDAAHHRRDSSPLVRSGAASPARAGTPAHPDALPSSATLLTSSGALIARPTPLRSPPAVRPYDHLRYLDVTACSHLTDQAVAGIVKYCPRLRNLMLAKCTRLTDESLFAICGLGKHLHYLHLGHVSNVTDAAVTAIARACTRLRYIDLAYCRNLTDASVFELAANLPRLKRIGLVRVVSITDESLHALQARTSLERIHLSYCDNLTVSAVNDMLQHLPRVTHLSLTGVSSFRKRALQQFCRAPPKDFNDHQRRSFCVFSGRGVHDLRKFLRQLGPDDLAALALPDPPDDAHAAAGLDPQQAHFQHQVQQQHLLAARFGNNAAHPAPQPGQGWPVAAPPAGPGAGPVAHAQAQAHAQAHAMAQAHAQHARAQAMVQARQAVALAAQRMQAAGAAGGGGAGAAGGARAGSAPAQGNMLGLQSLQQQQQGGAPAGAGAVGAPGGMHRFVVPAARPGPAMVVGGADGQQRQTVPITRVASGAGPQSPPRAGANRGEDDDGGSALAAGGAGGAGAGGARPRSATVTQRNYRSAPVTPAPGPHRAVAADAMQVDEDDEGSESGAEDEGDEEDVHMM